MPCRTDYADHEADKYAEVKTRLACEYCKLLESGDFAGRVPDWAEEWWEHHKTVDARRKETLRKAAYSKLTKEELEALGLPDTLTQLRAR